ncbi:hypothetical protein JTB14_025971 [Gonioctena quinquepunctata]|nr:hypothetical protein JTB14_025971 [Gonioctena quinquepunctata]
MMYFFKTNHILSHNQTGFREAHNTSSALVDVNRRRRVTGALNEGEVAMLILLDYSNAFDTINHKVLLAKLRFYGFSNPTLNLIKGYLTDRGQKVNCNDLLSNKTTIHAGVPQGAVIGPLLFVINTADIIKLLTCFLR